jgi:hypothetical protein
VKWFTPGGTDIGRGDAGAAISDRNAAPAPKNRKRLLALPVALNREGVSADATMAS